MTTTQTEKLIRVDGSVFDVFVIAAMARDERVNEFLSHGVDYSAHKCFLTEDGQAGFAISPDGDLQSVFNVSGRKLGRVLVSEAIANGAHTLDCFDGYLPGFYASLGFTEARREANWTAGGPDVVFMVLAKTWHRDDAMDRRCNNCESIVRLCECQLKSQHG